MFPVRGDPVLGSEALDSGWLSHLAALAESGIH